MPLPKTRFSCTTLKSIALVLMLLDHIHYFFAFTGVVPELFNMLGRLSAPLFLFCTVEGFAHTHDRKRYFLRIWAIGAGMAAIEFFMMYGGLLRRGDGFYPQNAIFQALTLLCIVWQGIDWLRTKRYVRGAAAILGVFLWPFVVSALLVAVPQIFSTAGGFFESWHFLLLAHCRCGPALRMADGAFCWAAYCCICCGSTGYCR